MKAKQKKHSELSQLSRLELVELIYDIRRDNLALEERCKELEARLAVMEQLDVEEGLGHRLSAIEERLADVQSQVRAGAVPRTEAPERPAPSEPAVELWRRLQARAQQTPAAESAL